MFNQFKVSSNARLQLGILPLICPLEKLSLELLDKEIALYDQAWSLPEYSSNSPGEQNISFFLQNVLRVLNPPDDSKFQFDQTVLDAGAGSGKGALALDGLGFKVKMCDISDAGLTDAARALPFEKANLWSSLHLIARGFSHPNATRFDFVYCCDVLEHIPPQFTMLAIDHMLRVARYGVFLSVSLVPDNFGIWMGQALHQTVQPFTWWRDSLRELGTVGDARDLHNCGVFFISYL